MPPYPRTPSIDQAMARLLAVATSAIEPVQHSSISLRSLGEPGISTPWASTDLARKLDHIQYELGRGPCVAAVESGLAQSGAMAAPDFPWPELVQAAKPYSLGSVLSTPIQVGDGAFGALNLYSGHPDGFVDAEAERAAQIAGLASALLTVGGPYASEVAVAASDARDSVRRAQGILMGVHGCGPREAFAILRRTAVRDNRPLPDVAHELLATVRESDA